MYVKRSCSLWQAYRKLSQDSDIPHNSAESFSVFQLTVLVSHPAVSLFAFP